MTSNWPLKIIIKFVSEGKQVSNVMTNIVINSSKKNDYTLPPMVSNLSGIIILDRDFIVDEIKKVKLDFPMDYQGDLSDCHGLTIVVEDIETLNSKIARLSEYYPEEASMMMKLVEKSNNQSFRNCKKYIKLPLLSDEILINLARKRKGDK